MDLPGTSETTEQQQHDLEQLLKAKNYPFCRDLLRKQWLSNPLDLQTVQLWSRLMKEEGKKELAFNLAKLAEAPQALSDDAQNLFEAGFKLIDEHELQLAVVLLERCARLLPDESIVQYELGFALMTIGQFARAIPYLEKSASLKNDYDTTLNLAVCFTMERQIDRLEMLIRELEKLAASNDELKEVAQRKVVLKRLESLPDKKIFATRDWLFALYGSLSLQERAVEAELSYSNVAWTLLILKQVLSELGLEFDVIEFYSPLSRPLAEAFAHMLDLPVEGYKGPDKKDRRLLMMAWASNIIGPHKAFVKNSDRRALFAYGVSQSEPLPLIPDIVGTVASQCCMPWAESSEEIAEARSANYKSELPDQEQIAATENILAQVHEWESKPEIISSVQAIVDYYKTKRELLTIRNSEHFPERAEYTAEIS